MNICVWGGVNNIKYYGLRKSRLGMDLMSVLSISHDVNNPFTTYSTLNSSFTLLIVILGEVGNWKFPLSKFLTMISKHLSSLTVFNSSTHFHNLLSCKVTNGPNFLHTN